MFSQDTAQRALRDMSCHPDMRHVYLFIYHLHDVVLYYTTGHLKSGSTPAMEAGEVTEMASGAKVVDRSNLQGCAKIANSMAALEIKD